MSVSPYASEAKVNQALTAIGAELIGQNEQQLLQQLVVAAATASGGGGGGSVAFSAITGSPTDNTNLAAALNAKLPIVDPNATNSLTVTGIGEGESPIFALVTPRAGSDDISRYLPSQAPGISEFVSPAESGTLLTNNSIIQGTQLADTTVPTAKLENPGIEINGVGVNLGGSITVTANLPTGGTTGQILAKQSNADGDADWETPPSLGPDVRIYTADATWDNPSPSTARRVFVRLVGGGGGGGSGRKGVAGVNRFGGGGAAAGAVTEFWTLTTELASTRPVTIGAGGIGGTAVTTDSTNGNSGTAGGDTNFAGVTAIGGAFGVGGGSSSGTAGATTANSCVSGVAVANNGSGGAGGAVAGAAGTTVNTLTPTGGGGGGGLDTSNTNRAGGTGGPMGAAAIITLAGGTAGLSGGGNGGNGNDNRGSGTGGGGGGSNNLGAGGRGGNGGGFGAGGGGGAAGTNIVGDSGAGGNGTQGYALIITY